MSQVDHRASVTTVANLLVEDFKPHKYIIMHVSTVILSFVWHHAPAAYSVSRSALASAECRYIVL